MILKFISDLMDELQIPYEFGEWSCQIDENRINTESGNYDVFSVVPNPYFIGEFNEVASNELEENGYQETSFIITGTGTKWIDLHNAQIKIKKHLPQTAILEDKSGIAVFYDNALIIPTEDSELKRIQINLTIKEWSVI